MSPANRNTAAFKIARTACKTEKVESIILDSDDFHKGSPNLSVVQSLRSLAPCQTRSISEIAGLARTHQ